jgi:hypothetical protein
MSALHLRHEQVNQAVADLATGFWSRPPSDYRSKAAKRFRHDFAKLAIKIALTAAAGKEDGPAFIEHIEPDFLQPCLQQLAQVRLDQDQKNFVPARTQQPFQVVAKRLVLPDDHEIAVPLPSSSAFTGS